MKNIVRIKFGSHLYGTSTPESDLDFKSIFIPSAREILLQRVRPTVTNQRPKAAGEKNFAGEIDEERFSLQKFLKLASEGQTVAIDVLFAPAWSWIGMPSHEWIEILENRHRLLTRKSASFIGYARTQANKYGIKGSRVASARAALQLLEFGYASIGASEKLSAQRREIHELVASYEHMAITTSETPHGQTEYYWEVCNKKMPFNASIKSARDVMARIVDEYGKRALMAESQQGVDWKALSHAVRVGHQAIELLSTGNVTFPLQNAAHILRIKKGELLYQEVAEEIEELLVLVERAAEASVLPEEPDMQWIDDFVERVYRAEVLEA